MGFKTSTRKRDSKTYSCDKEKIIIAGGRDIKELTLIYNSLLNSGWRNELGVIVSGGAPGVDSLAIRAAKINKISYKVFMAEWENFDLEIVVPRTRKDGTKYNAAAGHVRNKQMAEYATRLIAIWDGKSRGTKNMIDQMKKLNKLVYIYRVKKESGIYVAANQN